MAGLVTIWSSTADSIDRGSTTVWRSCPRYATPPWGHAPFTLRLEGPDWGSFTPTPSQLGTWSHHGYPSVHMNCLSRIIIKLQTNLNYKVVPCVGGQDVPPCRMSPRTSCPRAQCPPGHSALVQTVPPQCRMSPRLSYAREQLHWTIAPEKDPIRILKCHKGRTSQFEVSIAFWKTIYETTTKYG